MIRIGILFGGPAREREISFAGGKTAFEHLDKSLFIPVPIFIDSFGRFILLNHEHMYASQIRDFYPGTTTPQTAGFQLYIESFPELRHAPISSHIGELLPPDQLAKHIDFALIAMHGPDCEDGAIQGLLEWYKIPYSGPGILGSSIGIDKILQNRMLELVNGQVKKTSSIKLSEWTSGDTHSIFEHAKATLGLPIVIKAPHQGSSIGVAIVKQDDYSDFEKGVNQCFFIRKGTKAEWESYTSSDKQDFAQRIANLDEGIGYPVVLNGVTYYQPLSLINALDTLFTTEAHEFTLFNINAENEVLLEAFIEGQEFSCGCIQHEDSPAFALPPTEVIKLVEVFDFNSKYKTGGTRKRIPVDTTEANNLYLQEQVRNAAASLGMVVCVRIDGFLTASGEVLLHDPNTIPGMSPTSLIFKQMAEVGLNVTNALTYFIRQSLYERARTSKHTLPILKLRAQLDQLLEERRERGLQPTALVIEPTNEAFAKARNWFSQKSAQGTFKPEIYLQLHSDEYILLPIQLLFKETIEDVLNSIKQAPDPVIVATRQNASALTQFYAGDINFTSVTHTNTSSFIEWIDTY